MGSPRYLAEGERLVLRVRRHYSVLVGPFLTALGVLVAAGFLGFVVSPGRGSDWFDTFAGLIAVVFALRFAWKLWEWWDDRIVVTDRRIIETSGVLTRKVASMPLVKITDMTYQRTLPGRILGYGDLVLESAGQHQAFDSISHLPKPDEFYRTVTDLVTAAPALASTPPKPEPERSKEDDDTGPIPRVIV